MSSLATGLWPHLAGRFLCAVLAALALVSPAVAHGAADELEAALLLGPKISAGISASALTSSRDGTGGAVSLDLTLAFGPVWISGGARGGYTPGPDSAIWYAEGGVGSLLNLGGGYSWGLAQGRGPHLFVGFVLPRPLFVTKGAIGYLEPFYRCVFLTGKAGGQLHEPGLLFKVLFLLGGG